MPKSLFHVLNVYLPICHTYNLIFSINELIHFFLVHFYLNTSELIYHIFISSQLNQGEM